MPSHRLTSCGLATLLLVPALFAPVGESQGSEVILAFDREGPYHLGTVGDVMRLEGASTVSQAPDTIWQLRVLDPSGAERGSWTFEGATFSGALDVPLAAGDLHGSWTGEARRYLRGSQSWLSLATIAKDVTATPPPTTPSLTVTAQDNRLDLTWTGGASGATWYEVQIDDDRSFGSLQDHLVDVAANAHTFNGRHTTEYHVRVRARDAYHDYGPWATVTRSTAPSVGSAAFERSSYIIGPSVTDTMVARVRALGDVDTEWRIDVLDPHGTVRASAFDAGSPVDLPVLLALSGASPIGQWSAEVWSRAPGGEYALWTRAFTRVDTSPAPGAPILWAQVTNNHFSFTWLPNGGHAPFRYDLDVATTPDFAAPVLTRRQIDEQHLSWTGLWDTLYHVRARAVDARGGTSSWATITAKSEDVPLADLAIGPAGVWLVPDEALRGVPVQIRARVENRGDVAVGNAEVTLVLDGVPTLEQTTSLLPGEARTLTFTHTFTTEGAKSVQIVLDRVNAVRERSEANNVATLGVDVRASPVDLQIRTADVVVSPAIPVPGQTLTVTVTVKNLGTRQAPESKLRVRAGTVAIGSSSIEPGPGQSVTRVFTWVPPGIAEVEIEAIADADQVLLETDETNNRAKRVVTVGEVSDLVLDSVSLAPQGPHIGDRVDVTVRVRNTGNLPSPVTIARVRGTHAEGAADIADLAVPAIEPGAMTTVTTTWRPAIVGVWTVRATVDPDNVVLEADEADNEATATHSAIDQPLPDLRVTLLSAPDEARHNTGSRVEAEIKNEGRASAHDVVVRVVLRDPAVPGDPGLELASRSFTLVAKGETLKLSIPFTMVMRPGQPSESELAVTTSLRELDVDPTDDDAAKRVRVTAPDLAVSTTAGLVRVLGEPGSQPYSVTVRNVGSAPAEALSLRFRAGDQDVEWVVRSENLPAGGLRPGDSFTVPLPALESGTPGVYPTTFLAQAARKDSLAGGAGSNIAGSVDLEPAWLYGDNTLQPMFVKPGLVVSLVPKEPHYENQVFAPGEEGYASLQVYGRNAESFLQAPPEIKGRRDLGWWTGTESGERGALTGVFGTPSEAALQGLTAQRVFRFRAPTTVTLADTYCPWFGPDDSGCDGNPFGGWSKKVQGHITGVQVGYTFDLDVRVDGLGSAFHAVDTQSTIVWDGVLFRLADAYVPVQPDGRSTTLTAGVAVVVDGVACRPDMGWWENWVTSCGSVFDGVRVVDETTGRNLGFTISWPNRESIDLKAPAGYSTFPALARFKSQGHAASGVFHLVRPGPALVADGGQAQRLFGGLAALDDGTIYAAGLKAVSHGLRTEQIDQAVVRLCYDPAKIRAWGEADRDDWWGPAGQRAAELLQARDSSCGTGKSAVYRTMPLTRDKRTSFSFLVQPVPGAAGSTLLTAEIFDEKGRVPTGRTTPQLRVDEAITIRDDHDDLVSDQFVDSLLARLEASRAAASVASLDHEAAFALMATDFGKSFVGLIVDALFFKLSKTVGDGLEKAPRKDRAMGEILVFVTQEASKHELDEFYKTVGALADGADVTPADALSPYGNAIRRAIDEVASGYQARILAGDYTPGLTFTPVRARDLLYKLDVAENAFLASDHKDGRLALPSLRCPPVVSPPQPGQPANERVLGEHTICNNREMHPLAGIQPHYPNLIAFFYHNQVNALNDQAIDWLRTGLSYASLAFALVGIVFFPAAPIFGTISTALAAADLAIAAIIYELKESAFQSGAIAFPLSMKSLPRILEEATGNPRCCTDYFTPVLAPGMSSGYSLAPELGTTGYTARLVVPPGEEAPQLTALTPAGYPIEAETKAVAAGTELSVTIPLDAPGNFSLTLRGPASGELAPYSIALSQDLVPELRFVRLNVTGDGEPVDAVVLEAEVDGVAAPIRQVLGSLPEVRVLEGSTLRVRATAPRFEAYDRTTLIQLPDTIGVVDVALVPLLDVPPLVVGAVATGGSGTLAVQVANPGAAARAVEARVRGLPFGVTATIDPTTVGAGASATLDLDVQALAWILPGLTEGLVELVEGETSLGEFPVEIDVRGAYLDLPAAPVEAHVVRGQTRTIDVALRNAGNLAASGIVPTVEGPSWARLEAVPSSLSPGVEAVARLVLTPPAGASPGTTNLRLRFQAPGSPEENTTVAVSVYASVAEPAQHAVATRDLDHNGAPDSLLVHPRGGSVFVGLRDSSGGELGLELARHRLNVGGTTWLDTGTGQATVVHAEAPGAFYSHWTTGNAQLQRVVRTLPDGAVEILLLGLAPGDDPPEHETVHLFHGRHDPTEGLLHGTWADGDVAPVLRLDLGGATISPATLRTTSAFPVRYVVEPASLRSIGDSTPAEGDEALFAGRVTAVLGDGFVFEDAAGGAFVHALAPALQAGSVGVLRALQSGGALQLVAFEPTGSAEPAPPVATTLQALQDLTAQRGTALVDIAGSVQTVAAASITLGLADGSVTVRYEGGATVPPVTAGQATLVRAFSGPDGTRAIPPFAKHTTSGSQTSGWYTQAPTVSVTSHGAVSTRVRLDGAETAYAGPFQVSGDGAHAFEALARDTRGNDGPTRETIRIDTLPPATVLSFEGPARDDHVHSSTRLVLAASDAGIGVDRTTICIGGTCSTYAGPTSVPQAEGPFELRYRSHDLLGRAETETIRTLRVDASPPAVGLSFSGNLVGGWYRTRVDVTITCNDGAGSGCETIESRLGTGPWTPYTGPFTLFSDGVYVVEARATDRLDQAAQTSATVRIDTQPPHTTKSLQGPFLVDVGTTYISEATRVRLTAVDDGSGVASTSFRIDGGPWQAYTTPFAVTGPEGIRGVGYSSTDNLGTVEDPGGFEAVLDTSPPVTTITRPKPDSVTVDSVSVELNPPGIWVGDTFFRIPAAPPVSPLGRAVIARGARIDASAVDAHVGVQHVTFRTDQSATYEQQDPTAPYQWSWVPPSAATGDRTIFAAGEDRLQHVMEAQLKATVVALPATPSSPGSTQMDTKMVTLINEMNLCIPVGWQQNANLWEDQIAECVQGSIDRLNGQILSAQPPDGGDGASVPARGAALALAGLAVLGAAAAIAARPRPRAILMASLVALLAAAPAADARPQPSEYFDTLDVAWDPDGLIVFEPMDYHPPPQPPSGSVSSSQNSAIRQALAAVSVTDQDLIDLVTVVLEPDAGFADEADAAIAAIRNQSYTLAAALLQGTPLAVSLWCGPEGSPTAYAWIFNVPAPVTCGGSRAATLTLNLDCPLVSEIASNPIGHNPSCFQRASSLSYTQIAVLLGEAKVEPTAGPEILYGFGFKDQHMSIVTGTGQTFLGKHQWRSMTSNGPRLIADWRILPEVAQTAEMVHSWGASPGAGRTARLTPDPAQAAQGFILQYRLYDRNDYGFASSNWDVDVGHVQANLPPLPLHYTTTLAGTQALVASVTGLASAPVGTRAVLSYQKASADDEDHKFHLNLTQGAAPAGELGLTFHADGAAQWTLGAASLARTNSLRFDRAMGTGEHGEIVLTRILAGENYAAVGVTGHTSRAPYQSTFYRVQKLHLATAAADPNNLDRDPYFAQGTFFDPTGEAGSGIVRGMDGTYLEDLDSTFTRATTIRYDFSFTMGVRCGLGPCTGSVAYGATTPTDKLTFNAYHWFMDEDTGLFLDTPFRYA